jgi:ornithine decarboxylase
LGFKVTINANCHLLVRSKTLLNGIYADMFGVRMCLDFEVLYINGNVHAKEPFYARLMVRLRFKAWKPLVPHLPAAVRCNDNQDLLRLLARAGLGFDCASAAEIQKVLPLVGPDGIIFAHPQKNEADIRYALSSGVSRMVFDSEDELMKIASISPSATLFLRLHAEDETSLVRLGDKFSAHASEAQELLRSAATLGLQVVGLFFHVGSAASDPGCIYPPGRSRCPE